MNNQKLEIHELISRVREELRRAQYSENHIEEFSPTWTKLREYMMQKGEPTLNARIGLDFLEAEYGLVVFKKLPRHLAVCARAVNVLTDYQQHGIILSKARRKVHSYHPQFQALFQGYIDYRRSEGCSEDTLQS